MPFQDDNGIDLSTDRGPFWGAFATLRDQPERLIAVNAAWSVNLIPGLLALGYPDFPLALRLLFYAYSAVAITPATMVLYAMVDRAVASEPVSMEAARDALWTLALPSFRVLTPLGSALLLLGWLSLAPPGGLLLVSTGAQLLLLLGCCCAGYWGVLLAAAPTAGALQVLRQSLRLLFAYPGRTLMLAFSALLALFFGALSIGGLFLIVPVVLALLQTHMVYDLRRRRALRNRRTT
ncbi:MAG: hypothetical protein H7Z42_10590 [Roseiflexaceae bacterium]|nr:hypothetical protein [Roseiflexaceae bacterium]